MMALNAAPAIGSTVRIPARVRRHVEDVPARVKGVTPHAVLVAIGGKHRYVDPAQVRR